MPHTQPGSAPPAGSPGFGTADPGSSSSSDDTLDLELPQWWDDLLAQRAGSEPPESCEGPPGGGGLLDSPGDWPAADTGVGRFQLVPVRPGT